ncbi:predicted protein [Arabidopsis lyrata subsp. lyrata]|uniref:Predicted protein n=1 Tax=Arabidopsis lyrata subsp. lyrata TaxID=81972 RepID=D7MAP7_ARALL|nr:predicted protein [Arabidopsis lyrata subsp. lyrata]
MADDLKSLAAKAKLVRAQLRSHGQQVEQINNPRQREILNTDLEEISSMSARRSASSRSLRKTASISSTSGLSSIICQKSINLEILMQTWNDIEKDSNEDPEVEDMEAVFLKDLEEADLLADIDELHEEQPNEELNGDVDLDDANLGDVDELPVGPLGDGFPAEIDIENEDEPTDLGVEMRMNP